MICDYKFVADYFVYRPTSTEIGRLCMFVHISVYLFGQQLSKEMAI